MGVGTFFSILRRLFSLPPEYAESGKSLEELEPVYRRWEIYSLPLMLAVVPPLIAACWWILYRIGIWNAGRFDGAVYHLWPFGLIWGVPAGILGLFTSAVPIDLFYRWRLKDRYPEFERYANLRHGYDQQRAALPIMGFFLSLVLIAVVLILHNRVIFTKDEVIQYPFFSLSSVSHKYGEIVDIRTAPKRRTPLGKLRDNNEYQTEFADGSVWYTLWEPAALAPAEKREIMEFLSKKSGKPIRRVPVLE